MKKIVVIEDQPAMRANVCELLTLEGYRAIPAADGLAGIALARQEKPDLILCDIMMPGCDGLAVLAALRADPALANVPFIFLTARGERPDVRTGMNLGADDYLIKPVGSHELLAAVAARFERQSRQPVGGPPDFADPTVLEALGLSPREAEVLCWLAQGKSNAAIATILGPSEATVKRHVLHIFEKLGLENRSSATRRAIEALSGQG